ncbi:hypothetical protein ACFZ8E_07420 [Methylobacterium sp. HMF5984]|uniref:hypothetical protein n=1 Tax=Methylobacterium sp. HMF5984 TaxID=3367370 RepID=UPI0038542175
MAQIDVVHKLLDDMEMVISYLNGRDEKTVEKHEIDDLIIVLNELHGWGTAYTDLAPKLSLAAPLVSKYLKNPGPFDLQDTRIVAQRIRSYLRSLDQRTDPVNEYDTEFFRDEVDSLVESSQNRSAQAQPSSPPFTFQADSWSFIALNSELKAKISATSVLLDSIVVQVKRSNLPPDQQAITDIERNQLIAILETTLGLLRNPVMVERGLMNKMKDSLAKVAKKSAEKELEQGIGHASETAASWVQDLINMIW